MKRIVSAVMVAGLVMLGACSDSRTPSAAASASVAASDAHAKCVRDIKYWIHQLDTVSATPDDVALDLGSSSPTYHFIVSRYPAYHAETYQLGLTQANTNLANAAEEFCP